MHSPEVAQKLQEADDIDERREEEIKALLKPLRAKSDFMKVMKFNSPRIVIFLAVVSVMCAGGSQPFFGWIFANMMTSMTAPVDIDEQLGIDWRTNLRNDIVKYTIYILIIGGVIFVSYIGKIYLFSFLGERVTLKVRQLLYYSIL